MAKNWLFSRTSFKLANLKFTGLIIQWNLCIADTIRTKKVPAFTDFSKIVWPIVSYCWSYEGVCFIVSAL